MESRTTHRFREAYASCLKKSGGRHDKLTYSSENIPATPVSDSRKSMNETNTYSIRVGLGYRALGIMEGSTILWTWIGSRAEYDRLI